MISVGELRSCVARCSHPCRGDTYKIADSFTEQSQSEPTERKDRIFSLTPYIHTPFSFSLKTSAEASKQATNEQQWSILSCEALFKARSPRADRRPSRADWPFKWRNQRTVCSFVWLRTNMPMSNKPMVSPKSSCCRCEQPYDLVQVLLLKPPQNRRLQKKLILFRQPLD